MKQIEEALKELKLTWNIVQISEKIIEGLLVFTISLSFIIFLGFEWTIAFLPLLIYIALKSYEYYKGNLFKSIEEKAPLLKEKLRTAAEYFKEENQIVDELNNEVIKDIKRVKSSFLVDYKTISYKLFGLIFLSFITITISLSNINLGGIDGISENLNRIIFISGEEKMEIPEIAIASEEGDLNIYADASVAELGLKKGTFEINALDSEIDVNKVSGVEKKNFAPKSIPKEIYTTYDVSYNESIPKENQKIVRNYFERITR